MEARVKISEERESHSHQISQLTDALGISRAAQSTLQGEKHDLEMTIASMEPLKSQEVSLKAAVDAGEAKRKRIKSELIQAEKKGISLNVELSSLKKDLEAVKSSLSASEAESSRLQAELLSVEQKGLLSFETAEKRHTDEMREVTEKKVSLVRALEEKAQIVISLEHEREVLRSKLKAAESSNEIARHEAETATLRCEIERKEGVERDAQLMTRLHKAEANAMKEGDQPPSTTEQELKEALDHYREAQSAADHATYRLVGVEGRAKALSKESQHLREMNESLSMEMRLEREKSSRSLVDS